MRAGFAMLRLLGLLFLAALAGCQTAGPQASLGGADLTPPALQAPREVESEDGTRSFLASQTPVPARAPQVDFFVGMPQPTQGLVQVDGPAGPLWLYPQVIVQRTDLTRVATVRTAQGRHLVQFDLNALGARKLAEVSASNVGALLILVMDDRVAHVARIGGPMNQGSIYLAVPDDAAAQQLLRRIQG